MTYCATPARSPNWRWAGSCSVAGSKAAVRCGSGCARAGVRMILTVAVRRHSVAGFFVRGGVAVPGDRLHMSRPPPSSPSRVRSSPAALDARVVAPIPHGLCGSDWRSPRLYDHDGPSGRRRSPFGDSHRVGSNDGRVHDHRRSRHRSRDSLARRRRSGTALYLAPVADSPAWFGRLTHLHFSLGKF